MSASASWCDDMAETMYAAPGIGLAATQVDVHERVIVIDISENATIVAGVHQSGDHRQQRGCGKRGGLPVGAGDLSTRCAARKESPCERWTADGEACELDADGLLAVCIQHEMDHLLGKVFVEYLSRLKQNRIKTKLQKAGARAPSPSPRRCAITPTFSDAHHFCRHPPSLRRQRSTALARAGHDIALVLTQPDRPAGRGMKLTPSAR